MVEPPPPDKPIAQGRPLGARLLALSLRLRISGNIVYARSTGLNGSAPRLLTLIGNYYGATAVELVALTGMEKAQISRAIAFMINEGLVERPRLRARISLSARGQAAFADLMETADIRNDELTAGLTDEQVAFFIRVSRAISERAQHLLAVERERCDNVEQSTLPELRSMPERLRRISATHRLAGMVAPVIFTLTAYLQRSATLVYRRETGLSHFEGQMMTQIGENAPILLSELVELAQRDKSQVGRTMQQLEERGLIVRSLYSGRTVQVQSTSAGEALYARARDIAVARDRFLLAQLSADERRAYESLIEVLRCNAQAMYVNARLADRRKPRSLPERQGVQRHTSPDASVSELKPPN